jgi:hypothetical protein
MSLDSPKPASACRRSDDRESRPAGFQGCWRPARWFARRSWMANLVLLCHRHHWSVHEGGWQLVTAEDRRVLAIPPSHNHRTLPRAPDGTFAA